MKYTLGFAIKDLRISIKINQDDFCLIYFLIMTNLNLSKNGGFNTFLHRSDDRIVPLLHTYIFSLKDKKKT